MKIPFPLEQKDYFVYWVMGGCILFAGSSAFVNLKFAIIFLASSIVGLPALLLYFTQKARGVAGSFVKLLSLLIYLSVAESVIVPELTNAILRVVT
ncbi:hypothetical protein [Marinobacter salicampi]|uniref:hypothetical protein n=1 Tax=Marinobacter salicampi TaxID=435907 RepID=UPI00140C850C|nr:hypothetical protein [Marinobacter salicampi]